MTADSSAVPRRTIFVGRERELAQLAAALDDAMAGQGSVVAVTGEPGIGKTRLVQELERHANERGVTVHWGRTPESEAAPYWPWLRAIRSLLASIDVEQLQPALRVHADVLPRLFPELSPDGAVPPAPTAADESAQLRLFDGVTSLLSAAAKLGPVVLTLEDLHWADTSSLALLRYLAPEISGVPLLIVVTYRAEEVGLRPALSETVASLARLSHFHAVELAGLSEADVRAYLRGLTGAEPAAPLVTGMVERTQGNPFFLSELAVLQSGASIDAAVPATVKAAIEQRLARLSADCNDLLTMGAVAGRSFRLDLVEALSEHGEHRLLDLIDEALATAVLDDGDQPGTYQFHHALVQETILERLSAARRARLHGRVGEALEDLHGDRAEHAAEIAYHFRMAAAGQPAYAPRALEHTMRAAEQAERQFAWAEAAALYEPCLALAEQTSGLRSVKRAVVLVAFADSGWRAGGGGAPGIALAAADIFRELNDGEGFARAVLTAVRTTALWGSANMAPMLREALTLLDGADPHLESRLLGELVDTFGGDEAALPRANELVAKYDLPQLAARLHDRRGHQAAQAQDFDGAATETLRSFHEFERASDYSEAALSLCARAMWALHAGALDTAQERSEGALEYARLHHIARWESDALQKLATIGLLHCDDGLLVRLQELATPQYMVFVEAARLELTDPLRAVPVIKANSFSNNPAGDGIQLGSLARAQFHAGEADRAMATLGPWADALRRVMKLHIFFPLATVTEADEALIALADEALLREVYEWLKTMHGVRVGWYNGRGVDRIRGDMALRLGLMDEAAHWYETGLRWATEQRCPIVAGRCHQGLAEVAAGHSNPITALVHFNSAAELFERHGATFLLGKVRERKRELLMVAPDSPARPAGLTEREVDVLRLLAQGRSNAAIAAELVIARATVARHVSNILNKTGLSNRTEAAAWAMARGRLDPGTPEA